jgi:queuosine precursor transporter
MWALIYVVSIVAVNWLFTVIPPIGIWQPTSVIVGLTFIFRDMAQRKIGHWVLPVMLVGGAISYVMADPFVAIASVSAFLISEGVDWMVYKFTKRPLKDRILWSSAVGTPIDSIVFTAMIGILSPLNVVVMTVSKMIGAVVVWFSLRNKEVK